MSMNKIALTRYLLPHGAVLGLLLGLVVFLGCESDGVGPDESASIQVLLVDAPSDMLDSAHVWISRVYLVGGGGEEPDTAESSDGDVGTGRLDLFSDSENPLVFDLLQLQNGVTGDLTGIVGIEAADYQGLRLVVDSAKVTLSEEYSFAGGERQGVLNVPSGSTSGIKVKISDVLELQEDETLTIVVDMDVNENFTINVDQQSGDVRDVRFRPVIREASRTRDRQD